MTEDHDVKGQEASGDARANGTRADPSRAAGDTDQHGTGAEAATEVRADPHQEITDVEAKAAKRANGGAAVVYECPHCKASGVIPDPGAAMAWFQGVPIVCRCFRCAGVIAVPNARLEAKAKQRILTANDPLAKKIMGIAGKGRR